MFFHQSLSCPDITTVLRMLVASLVVICLERSSDPSLTASWLYHTDTYFFPPNQTTKQLLVKGEHEVRLHVLNKLFFPLGRIFLFFFFPVPCGIHAHRAQCALCIDAVGWQNFAADTSHLSLHLTWELPGKTEVQEQVVFFRRCVFPLPCNWHNEVS